MNRCQKIAIIGGRGNGRVIAQIIADTRAAGMQNQVVGYLNDHEPEGSLIGEYPVLGKPCQWRQLPPDTLLVAALLTVGKMQERTGMIEHFGIPAERLARVIHPTAVIADDVRIGPGSVIASHVTCQPGSTVGMNSIIRAGANIGHDVKVDDFVDIGPNCTLCGYAVIEKGAHIAANAVVRDGISVGQYGVLSAGSVALKTIPSGTTWMGNPARRVG